MSFGRQYQVRQVEFHNLYFKFNSKLFFQPDKGGKRKILDLPDAKIKEKKKKEKSGRETSDEVDNFFKKILKKQEPTSRQEVQQLQVEERKPSPSLQEDELSAAEKERILAAVENEEEVINWLL